MFRRFAIAVFLFCCTLFIAALQAATVTWRSSTDGAFWVDKGTLTTTAWDNDQTSYISLDETQTDQEIFDWGGCVNERPWDGLMKLSQANRDSAVRAMFDTVEGICTDARCPIGMSDMAMGHYADDDSFTVDYTMAHFSIAEDQKYLIPWLKAAMKWNPHLRVWGSPWTQPPWMKTTNDYYGGSLNTDAQTRNAYVLYLEMWCQAFRAQGINVWCIHLQNEMEHNNPGWLVTHFEPADMRDFIKLQYPKFRQDDVPVETGLGTCVQDDNPPTVIPTVLSDTVANSYVSCIAVQYSTLNAQYCHSTWPLKIVWLSETPAEAGFAWSDGEANWSAMHDYLVNGVNSYNQWDIANMVNGVSNQGLKWGAPIQIDTAAKTYTRTPIYWQIKHITYYVKPGALRIKSTGNYTNHLAFRNRNGQNAVIVANTTASGATVAINLNGQKIKPTLPAHSFNTFCISGTSIPDISPFNQIEAEKYTGQSGTYIIPCSEGGSCLSLIHNNEWAYYYHLDFGTGANSFQARVAGTVGGSIEIRPDSLTATPVGTCTVPSTGGATTWQTVSCNLTTPITGKHILYLKFKGTGAGNLFNLNWWKFGSSSGIKAVSETKEKYVSRISIVPGAGKTQTLRLEFAEGVTQGNLKVSLFDLNGRQIATLFNGRLSSSHLTLPLNRAEIGQGAYLIKVSLNNKIALVKTATL
ncbi:MAG: carbohydrate-binding protein [Chitinispirillaceae bacterium]